MYLLKTKRFPKLNPLDLCLFLWKYFQLRIFSLSSNYEIYLDILSLFIRFKQIMAYHYTKRFGKCDSFIKIHVNLDSLVLKYFMKLLNVKTLPVVFLYWVTLCIYIEGVVNNQGAPSSKPYGVNIKTC